MMDISVVVPVYNKELYLEDCINSLVNQNINLILVDDKSTDRSLDILRHYKNKYENIKLIKNNKNLGVSESRNIGIDCCKTKYVGFVDADDTVEDGFFNYLNENAKKCDYPDIVRGNFKLYEYDIFTNKKVLQKQGSMPYFKNKNLVKNKDDFLAYETISCCNKIFKKSFLDKGFLNLSYEDEEFTLRNIIKSKSILYLDELSYCYNMDIGMHYKKNNNKSLNFLSLFKIYDHLFELDSKYYDILLDRLLISLFSKMVSITNWEVSDDFIFQIFDNIFKYMNYKYPNWKKSKCYSLFVDNINLRTYTKYINKFSKEDSIDKIKTLIKS